MLPPTPLTAQAHSRPRVGPVALARVPTSFRPATLPRPPRELDTHSQIWVEKTCGAVTRIPSPPRQESGVGGLGFFLHAEDCSKVWALGMWGWEGPHVRMVALELKIAKCREKVIGVSAVLPVLIPRSQGWPAPPPPGRSSAPLLPRLPPILVFITLSWSQGVGRAGGSDWQNGPFNHSQTQNTEKPCVSGKETGSEPWSLCQSVCLLGWHFLLHQAGLGQV